MKKYIIALVVILLVGGGVAVAKFGGLGNGNNLVATSTPVVVSDGNTVGQANPIACTEEAKQCPDGSYVGRTGPKCEFEKCPTVTVSSEAGIHTGYIKKVYVSGGKFFIDIDFIDILSGYDAVKAQIEDNGSYNPSKSVADLLNILSSYRKDVDVYSDAFQKSDLGAYVPPNGNYDRNQNSKIRTFEVVPSATIKTTRKITANGDIDTASGYNNQGVITTLALFMKAFNNPDDYMGKGFLGRIDINSFGKVIEINEIFRP